MKRTIFILAALAAAGAHAQVAVQQGAFGAFDKGETCYSWEGGHKSAGSFSKCSPNVQVAVLMPAPVAAPAPVLLQSCPPIATPAAPKRKPIIPRKPKPRVQC